MKKIISLILTIFIVMSICACSQNGQTSTGDSANNSEGAFASQTSNGQVSSGINSNQQSNNLNNNTSNSTSSIINTPVTAKEEQDEVITKNTFITVNIPTTISNAIDIAMNELVLYENNTIDRDIIILPRVAYSNTTFIYWRTSDKNVIDIDGNVYRNGTNTVTLTAVFVNQNYCKTKDYVMNIAPLKSDGVDISASLSNNKTFVNNVTELKSAISSATKGSFIVVKDGTYNAVSVEVNASGTQSEPIIIVAENKNGAVFTGDTQFKVKGSYVTIAGLKFENGKTANDKGVFHLVGDNDRITNNSVVNFNGTSATKWVSLSGKYAEVDHNTFDGKTTLGALLTVWREDTSSQYHHIHHNTFKNYTAGVGNGYETIRIGDSTESQSDAYCLVENNLFENDNGEVEIVSVKSGRNVIRNNTFKTSAGLLTFRHGKNNLALSNVFLCGKLKDAGGIRMYDGGHIIRNNYIDGVNTTSDSRGGIVVHSGVNTIGEIPTINAQWTAYNILIENNTIVDSKQSILFCGKYAHASENITLNNNYVSTSSPAITCYKLPSNIYGIGNVCFASSILDSNGSVVTASIPGLQYTKYTSLPPTNSDGFRLVAGIGASGKIGADLN